eukprot:6622978-Pyramimonas_sp.AAC.1
MEAGEVEAKRGEDDANAIKPDKQFVGVQDAPKVREPPVSRLDQYDAGGANPLNFLEVALAAKREAEKVEEVIGPVRAFFQKIAANKFFENGIVVLILGNCFSLAAYNPTQEETSAWNATLAWIDNGFNFCFTIEIIVRLIAGGSLSKHFSSAWNIFDFIIVLVGYSSFVGSSGAGGLRALRAMRALRPLRTVGQVKSLRTIANSFVDAMPLLMSVIG